MQKITGRVQLLVGGVGSGDSLFMKRFYRPTPPMIADLANKISGDRVRGARISAEHARERAREAASEADDAECLLWSEQMERFGGPAQPSPTIAQCLRLWLARGPVQTLPDEGEQSA
jgi:hypothetical protein